MNILTVVENSNNLVDLESMRTNESWDLLQWEVPDMLR